MKLTTRDPEQTKAVGQVIGSLLERGDVLLLYGPLGSGKTTLVKGIARGLGIDPQLVTSPTFTLISEYKGRVELYHVDLYRLDRPQEVLQVGITEYLNSEKGVTVVEWAEKLPVGLADDALEIEMEYMGNNIRVLTLTCKGYRSCQLMSDLKRALKDVVGTISNGEQAGGSTP